MTERQRRDRYIRKHYGKTPASVIALELNCTKGVVVGVARRLGLQTPKGPSRPPKPAPRKAPAAVIQKHEQVDRPLSRFRIFPNANALLDRGRPAESARVVEAVAAKVAPKDRLCSWRQYEGNGRSLPCCEPAKPGAMWCADCLEKVLQLKEIA